MPMAFNLFGEASPAERGGPCGGWPSCSASRSRNHRDIVFEWSPGRRNARIHRGPNRVRRRPAPRRPRRESRTVIGIETKYHEHSTKEKKPSSQKPEALHRYEEQTDFLVAIAETSGAFKPGWQRRVLETDLRQIWRDHLLALSMRQHPGQWTSETRYVLVYPRRNVSFARAAESYAELLQDGDTSFQARTVESALDAAFVSAERTQQDFHHRYLW